MLQKLFVIFGYTLSVLLILCGDCEAFGPVTHVNLGCRILGSLGLLAPGLRALLQTHSTAFLYGNMAADVIIAKNLASRENHCHNWSVGFGVLEEAESDPQRAFAWGYLCHLAADVVAHNYFVPWKLVEGFPARSTGHAYWEIRLDQKAPSDAWELVKEISRTNFQEQHGLLARTIQGTLFRFETNLTIFNGMLFVQRLKRWRVMLDRVERRSRWTLPDDETEEVLELAYQAVLSLLQERENALVCAADPTGIPNLHIAKQLRRSVRRLQNRRIYTPTQTAQVIQGIRTHYLSRYNQPFAPQHWPQDLTDPQALIELIPT